MAEKTEEPTPRKLRKARAEGDVPTSSALVRAVGLATVVALAPAAVVNAATTTVARLRDAISHPTAEIDAAALALDVVALSAPWLAVAALAATVTGVVQTGGVLAFGKLSPDVSRLDPFAGVARLVTREKLLSLARALAGACALAWATGRLLKLEAPSVVATTGSLASASLLVGDLLRRIAWWAAAIAVSLAVADVAVTHWAWLRRHRMTKDEVRRDHKEAEGDPEIRAARERAHRELADGAAVASVRDATVVIVNPTHLATALEYREGEHDAPRVVAAGEGDLARRMIAEAHRFGVPVVRDVPVAHALRELQPGDEIPEALYEAVAEILRTLWDAETPA